MEWMRVGTFLTSLLTGFAVLAAGIPAPPAGTSLAAVQAQAAKGDAASELALGRRYYSGVGVTQDYLVAADWFRKAALQGNVTAQGNVCYIYAVNKELPADYPQALDWCRKAADKGDVQGESILGYLYHEGFGTAQDYTQALFWLTKAGEAGDINSQVWLGTMYGNGEGVTQDYTLARSWFEKAVNQGDDSAAFQLARIYDQGLGTKPDALRALALIQKAADHRFPPAESLLGEFYEIGKGVNKDMGQADVWLRRAADAGYGTARTDLAIRHFSGDYKDIDDSQALDWLNSCGATDVVCLNDSAWFFATTPREDLRDPAKAVTLISKTLVLIPNNPPYMDTLAAAYAAESKFDLAVDEEQKAIATYPNDSKYDASRVSFGRRLQLYRDHKPYVDTEH
jgi:TPR repeat protein